MVGVGVYNELGVLSMAEQKFAFGGVGLVLAGGLAVLVANGTISLNTLGNGQATQNGAVAGQTAFAPAPAAPAVAPATAPASTATQIAEVARAATPAAEIPDASVIQNSIASALQSSVQAGMQTAPQITVPAPVLAPAQPAPAAAPAPQPQQVAQQAATQQPSWSQTNAALFSGPSAGQQLATSCLDDLQNFASQVKIYFPSGGVAADSIGLAQARLIANMAQSCPGVRVQVEGHSDPSGNPTSNLRLSEERARTVITRLGAMGVDTSIFVPAGFGDRSPSNISGPEGRAYYDRRVEFSILQDPSQVRATAAAFSGGAIDWSTAQCVLDLQAMVRGQSLFFAPRAVTAGAADIAAATQLANAVQACPGARLRLVGQFSDDVEMGETPTTGRLRAIVLMNMLVNAGVDAGQLIIASPSGSGVISVREGYNDHRVDFDIIVEEG